jgi:hypothetical protein
MKPKLLITLGCSYTEGVGCYDFNYVPKDFKINHKKFNFNYILNSSAGYDFYLKSKDRFHEKAFPNILGKKLGFNKVINLGLAGSSASGNLKVFFEKFYTTNFSDYEVLVFWLLPEPTRTSIYLNKMVHNIMFSEDNDFFKYYINNNAENIIEDIVFEQIFLLKSMEMFCKSKNYSFLFTALNNDFIDIFLKEFDSTSYLNKSRDFELLNFPSSADIYEYHSFEGHPNEKGYEYLANTIFNSIKEYHSHLIFKNPTNDFTFVWNGLPIERLP